MQKKDLLDFLSEYDDSYYIDGNIFYAEKAFIVYSAIKWTGEQRELNKITEKQVEAYYILIEKFIKDEILLYWNENRLEFKSTL
tara:strand:+ start:323 stop:574 length:252 start_codon:yes stop_codon:yes gene_type:complete